jgi:hypothetical protein
VGRAETRTTYRGGWPGKNYSRTIDTLMPHGLRNRSGINERGSSMRNELALDQQVPACALFENGFAFDPPTDKQSVADR